MTGAELRDLRQRLNLTRAQFAPLLFVSASAVAKYEEGLRQMSKSVAEHARRLGETVL